MLCLSFVVSSTVFNVIINLFSAACSKSIVKWDTVPFLSNYKIMCQGIQYFSQVSVLIHLIYFYHCLYISIYDNELLTTTLNWDIFCIVAFVFYCSKEEAVLLSCWFELLKLIRILLQMLLPWLLLLLSKIKHI